MKPMNQIKMESIVDSHRKKLLNGAITIQAVSMIVLVVCLVGLFVDPIHAEGYCIVFTFFSLIALFGIVQYNKHKRDFK
jgi:uncharacterized Tic20 family protein